MRAALGSSVGAQSVEVQLVRRGGQGAAAILRLPSAEQAASLKQRLGGRLLSEEREENVFFLPSRMISSKCHRHVQLCMLRSLLQFVPYVEQKCKDTLSGLLRS